MGPVDASSAAPDAVAVSMSVRRRVGRRARGRLSRGQAVRHCVRDSVRAPVRALLPRTRTGFSRFPGPRPAAVAAATAAAAAAATAVAAAAAIATAAAVTAAAAVTVVTRLPADGPPSESVSAKRVCCGRALWTGAVDGRCGRVA
ncbi:hypothetical protein GCM10009548_79550 [Streptomyces malaysiensis subsp. malaysiensis]